ncbi:unnamed protein product [Trichobilharzia szidati]|nr:unnamed protein product [Trichobilharzia szidati]
MMATDVSVSGQPCTVAACSYATPQFITLAPGAPLKVMTVGPNGQLIQTTGLPQFMPTASVGMAINQPTATLQPQQTSIQVTPQRRVTTPQQQQQHADGRSLSTVSAAATAALFSGTAISSCTIPLVQPTFMEIEVTECLPKSFPYFLITILLTVC